MQNVWWLWATGSLVALILEANLAGSFVFVFFALGALVTAICAGLGGVTSIWQQALCFSSISVVSLACLRRPIMRWGTRPQDAEVSNDMVGSLATVQETMVPGAKGRVLHRGTVWTARNISQEKLVEGAGCVITLVDNLTVMVEPSAQKASP